MAQLNHILGVWEALQSIDIAVDQNRCVLVRNKNASCLKCAGACTSDCISVSEDGQLVLQTQQCIGCGTCATACPTGALTPQNPTDRQLFEACTAALQATGGRVAIACENMLEAAEGLYNPAHVVGVTCLGRIDESLIVLLARAGAEKVALVKGTCEGCRSNPGSVMAECVCETANALLRTWGRPALAEVAQKMPSFTKRQEGPAFDEKRRALLADMIDTTRSAARASANMAVRDALNIHDEEPELEFQKVQEDGTLPQALPNRRTRLLKGLASLGAPQDIMIGTRLWGHVIIDTQRCESCQMCATFCPTGALRKFNDKADGNFGVDHFPARCVKCRCCADICPAGAIEISEEVFAVDLESGSYERYAMRPRAVNLGPHQMFDSYKKLLNFDYIYER